MMTTTEAGRRAAAAHRQTFYNKVDELWPRLAQEQPELRQQFAEVLYRQYMSVTGRKGRGIPRPNRRKNP